MIRPIILLSALALGGCQSLSSENLQRTFDVGPQKYCRAGDVCFQAGDTWEFYPFAEGDASSFAQEGRDCWSESNRANWDACTHRMQ